MRTRLNISFIRISPVFYFSRLPQVSPKPIATMGLNGQSMNVTTRLQLGQRLRRRGAVSPRLHTSLWNASAKKRKKWICDTKTTFNFQGGMQPLVTDLCGEPEG